MAVLAANSHLICKDFYHKDQASLSSGGSISVYGVLSPLRHEELVGFSSALGKRRGKKILRGELKTGAFWQDVSKPTSIDMEAIAGIEQLDLILQQAQQLSQPIIIDWMAAWCRKCIYLKPKLEKLAAEYHTRIGFYYVDVNNVPQALVKRGNISKMPTIQLWKDGEMRAEVIGGHKGWLVVDEVREMIQKHG